MTTDAGDAVDERDAFRRYARWCAGGGVLGLAAFLRVLWLNGGFFAGSLFGGFYEVQAKALRQFRWNVPDGSLGIEAFVINKKSYEYYGPWPAIVRIPLTILFPSMNGKWTQPMMTVALVIAMVAVVRLSWRIRGLVRGSATPLTTVECVAGAVVVFVIGAGSVFTFLGSQAWVYHEAEMWGAALAVASYAALAEYLHAPTRRRLVLASLFAALSILSRASVGFGPVLALTVVAGSSLVPLARRLLVLPDHVSGRKTFLATATAAFTPVLAYMYVNYSKFESLFVFPSNKQIFSTTGVYRKEMLAQNHNSLFGFKFFPTAFVQYFRPDALKFQSLIPFVNFPRTAPVIGKSVLFDTIEPTSSAPSSMPFLVLLALIGAWCILRRNGRPVRARAPEVRVLLLGGLAGAFTVIPYSYIAQRYMSDFMPPLIIAALVGCHAVVHWSAERRRRRVAATVVGAFVVAMSVFVNGALAYAYHYETELNPEGIVTEHVENQYRIHSTFPGGQAPYVSQSSTLPAPMARGSVHVVGDCEGVYWSQGNTWPPSSKWYALVRTKLTGQYELEVTFADHSELGPDEVVTEPLMVRGTPGRLQTFAAIISRDRFSIGFKTEGHDDLPVPDGLDENGFRVGPTLKYQPGRTYNLQLTMDPNNGQVSALFSGYIAFAFDDFRLTTPQRAAYVFPTDQVTIGHNPHNDDTATDFSGTLRERVLRRPKICADLDLPRASTP